MSDAPRTASRALLVSACILLLLCAPAYAAQPCAETIIDDWSDNAVVDGTYAVPCYRQAIAGLPDDLLNYSSAADDINRALQARLQKSNSSSGGSSSAGGQESSGAGSSGATEPAATTAKDREPESKDKPAAQTEEETEPATTAEESAVTGDQGADPPAGDEATVATPAEDLFDQSLGDGGGSLPVPLIVLIAVAGLLAVALAVWLIRRQLGNGRPGSR